MCCTRVKMHSLSNKKQTLLVLGTINKTLIMHQCYRNLSYTQLKIAQDVQHWLNNRCTTVVQRLFTVVETRENNIDRISLFVIIIIVAKPC